MKRMTFLQIVALLLVAIGPARAADSKSFTGTVVRPLPTADVLLVKDSEGAERLVRLYGVSCPVAGQAHAQKAGDFINQTVQGASVTAEVLAVDSDDLPVAWLRAGEGPSINERLLQAGLAWWDELNAPQATRLKKIASGALAAGAGLWKDPAPLAPWDYRTSRNLLPVAYTVEAGPDEDEMLESVEAKTPTLTAKGTAAPPRVTPPAAAPAAPAAPEVPVDYLSLAAKHQPHIARDPEGNALGLTAKDITAIPGAGEFGFQDGDIVRSVNGIALTNEGQLLGLIGQLQNAQELKLVVIRNGQPVDVTIPL